MKFPELESGWGRESGKRPNDKTMILFKFESLGCQIIWMPYRDSLEQPQAKT